MDLASIEQRLKRRGSFCRVYRFCSCFALFVSFRFVLFRPCRLPYATSQKLFRLKLQHGWNHLCMVHRLILRLFASELPRLREHALVLLTQTVFLSELKKTNRQVSTVARCPCVHPVPVVSGVTQTTDHCAWSRLVPPSSRALHRFMFLTCTTTGCWLRKDVE